ncbi:unnamed protein product [Brassicogethes aeneus]|uniref:Uncharacterized protein n=1 Tax=Brassicogethes aeneus TaxID=1431903 RepID=A0A9P0B8Y0_BRAAE|nr:unnamed protein product [Brassicogethes aeneus]
MKLELIVVFCSFLIFSKASGAENKKSVVEDIIQKGHDYCVKESGVNKDLVLLAQKDRIYVNNSEFKCYLFCLFTHFKIIDKDTGKSTMSTFKKSFSKVHLDKYNPVFENCKVKDFKSKDYCEEAWEYVTTCFVNQPTFTLV